MRTGSPTLEAVAKAAGVSRATVSRVVNGSTTVDPVLSKRVNAAVERLRYIPNRAARSLAGSSSGSVALLVPENLSRFFADPFFAAILHGIAKRVDESDYVLNLLVASTPGCGLMGKTARYLGAGNVDGVVVVSHHSGDPGVDDLANLIPAVYGGRPQTVYPGKTHYVDVDNIAGSRLATRRLLDIGRTRIATVTGPLSMTAGADRLSGFLQEMRVAGAEPVATAHGDFTVASGAAAMKDILDTGVELDAVFVASDLMAVGAVNVLRHRGLRIPDDVAIVGLTIFPPPYRATWS